MGFLRCGWSGRWVGLTTERTLRRGIARELLLPIVAPIDRGPRGSRPGFGGSHGRLRRRGPGEDSTGRRPVARRFCDTPGEYLSTRPANAYSRWLTDPRNQPPVVPRTLPPRFDTPRACVISSAGRRRAVRFRAPGALCAFRGKVTEPVPEAGWRGSRTPDEADLSAEEAPPRQGARFPRPDADGRRPPDPGGTSRSRPKTADSLTVGRGSVPRLVMLSRPQDFAADRGTDRSRSPRIAAGFRGLPRAPPAPRARRG